MIWDFLVRFAHSFMLPCYFSSNKIKALETKRNQVTIDLYPCYLTFTCLY